MRSDIPEAIAALLPFPMFSPAAEMRSSKDIVGTAESAGQLTMLVAALKAAGLVGHTFAHGKTVKIDDSTLVKADIVASNGTLHIIDKVLLPQ